MMQGGERTVKTSGESEEMYVNSLFSGGSTQTANFTAYVNPYLVVSKGGRYTKHIYIGSQRIVSKLGDLDSYGSDPRRVEYVGTNTDGAKVDYKGKYQAAQQTIKDRYAKLEVPYHGVDNDDYVNGQGFCCDATPTTRSFVPNKNDNPELFQYYYHSDHLGSSSLITNLDGEVVQHIEYVPFGEVFIEERNNKWNTPYLFNAKELDEETGLYYYGARYYSARESVWLSTDPLQEKYPNISTYAYTFLNPVKYIDPDGLAGWPITRHWRRSDISGFANYAQNRIQEYKDQGIKDDCADFAVRLIVDYASENGLPLTLENRWGGEFDASSDKYSTKNEYLNAARKGIQAEDLPLNSHGIEQSETNSGDFEVMKYTEYGGQEVNWHHVVIFETINEKAINRSSIVWGNPGTDHGGTVLSGGKSNYPRLTPGKGTNWTILSGNLNSRWNVLNPVNMLPEPVLQRIEPPKIEPLKIDPVKINMNITPIENR